MENFKNYIGAIIGLIVGIVLVACRVLGVVIAILTIVGCAWLGNYVQKNKESLKENLKKFIDKI